MEENKAKTVNMGVKGNNQSKEKQKLTYEQLNDACNQLWQQNKQLVMKNRELEQFALNKRMDYLFKVLEFSDKFHSDFVVECVGEIESAMTIECQLDEDEIAEGPSKGKGSHRSKNGESEKEKSEEELPKGMELESEDLKGKGL